MVTHLHTLSLPLDVPAGESPWWRRRQRLTQAWKPRLPQTGARSLLRAFEATDIPEDPEQIFLTSWGEWWPKSVYERSLDRDLQDKWCPGREQIEKEAGL